MSDEKVYEPSGFKVPDLTRYVSGAYKGDSPPTRWLVEGRVPRGKVMVLAGEGGVGKSWLELELFAAINDAGIDYVWGGRVVKKGLPCLILAAEDDRSEIDNRLKAIRETWGVAPNPFGYIIPCAEVGSFTLFKPIYDGTIAGTDVYAWLDETLEGMKAWCGELGFVAIDTLSALVSINENDNTEATAVMTGLNLLAVKHDVTIIVLHHFAKGNGSVRGGRGASSVRGASGLVNSTRLTLGVEHVTGDEGDAALRAAGADRGRAIRMSVLKANINVNRAPVTLAWPEGSGMIDVSDLMGDADPKMMLLALIRGYNAKGQRVSKSGKGDGIFSLKSDSWPKTLRDMGRDKLQQAVQGLIDGKLLHVVEGALLVPEAVPEPQE